VPSDRRGDCHPRLARVPDLAVRKAEEVHGRDAQAARRVPLLCLAGRRQPVRRHAPVARTLIAVGRDAVGDLRAIPDELRYRPARPRLGIIRVRDDDQNALDSVDHPISLAGSVRDG